MQYFVRRGEKTQGPISHKQLLDFVRAKKIVGTDQIGNSAEGPFQELRAVWETIKNTAAPAAKSQHPTTQPQPQATSTSQVSPPVPAGSGESTYQDLKTGIRFERTGDNSIKIKCPFAVAFTMAKMAMENTKMPSAGFKHLVLTGSTKKQISLLGKQVGNGVVFGRLGYFDYEIHVKGQAQTDEWEISVISSRNKFNFYALLRYDLKVATCICEYIIDSCNNPVTLSAVDRQAKSLQQAIESGNANLLNEGNPKHLQNAIKQATRQWMILLGILGFFFFIFCLILFAMWLGWGVFLFKMWELNSSLCLGIDLSALLS